MCGGQPECYNHTVDSWKRPNFFGLLCGAVFGTLHQKAICVRGVFTSINPERLVVLAETLGVTTDYLLCPTADDKEREAGDRILIPLLLDDYLCDGWTSGHSARIRGRLAADFRGWTPRGKGAQRHKEQLDRVVRRCGRTPAAVRGGARG